MSFSPSSSCSSTYAPSKGKGSQQAGGERLRGDVLAPGGEDFRQLALRLVPGGDAVFDVEAGILAHVLDAAHELTRQALRRSSGVRVASMATVMYLSAATARPGTGSVLTRISVGASSTVSPSSSSGYRRSGAHGGGHLRRVSRSQGGLTAGSGLQIRPQQLVIRQHLVLDQGAFLGDELESLDVQLIHRRYPPARAREPAAFPA